MLAGAGERNRTPTGLRPLAPKASVSTNFTTPAFHISRVKQLTIINYIIIAYFSINVNKKSVFIP